MSLSNDPHTSPWEGQQLRLSVLPQLQVSFPIKTLLGYSNLIIEYEEVFSEFSRMRGEQSTKILGRREPSPQLLQRILKVLRVNDDVEKAGK